MSNAKKTEAVTTTGQSYTSDLTQVRPEEIEAQLSGLAKMETGINLAFRYKEFVDKGDKARGVFMGFVQFEKVDKETGKVSMLDAVAWMEADRTVYQNAGTALVSAFKTHWLAQGTPIEVEYQGQKKVERGYMKEYALRPLTKPKPE